jgi:NAD(P)-dependent dehydrogenase (short-subunit alcohol dehydrogenase family)
MDLQDRTVIVTGGASGMCRATALLLATGRVLSVSGGLTVAG